MNHTFTLANRCVLLGAAALVCTGCPNPNTYGTPRTTPVGKISHSIAAEAWGFKVEDDNGINGSGAYPTAPTYTLRVGVADTVDIGARISNLSSLGADVKWNFIKSESFDMAIDPGFQFFHFGVSSGSEDTSLSVIYLNAPLLFGINLGDSVSMVPSLGISYGYASASVNSADESDSASGTTGVMARGGLGFNFRISQRFALHPEVTFLKTLDDPTLLYMVGLGFNFGNLPKYGVDAVAVDPK